MTNYTLISITSMKNTLSSIVEQLEDIEESKIAQFIITKLLDIYETIVEKSFSTDAIAFGKDDIFTNTTVKIEYMKPVYKLRAYMHTYDIEIYPALVDILTAYEAAVMDGYFGG